MISWPVFLIIIIFSLITSVLPFLVTLVPYGFKENRKYRPKISVSFLPTTSSC